MIKNADLVLLGVCKLLCQEDDSGHVMIICMRARLTSVTLCMELFSAFLIGIFLQFGWSGVNLRICITCSDEVDIFKYLM